MIFTHMSSFYIFCMLGLDFFVCLFRFCLLCVVSCYLGSFCFCIACFCCVRFIFQYLANRLARKNVSEIWHILCRVGRETLISHWYVIIIIVNAGTGICWRLMLMTTNVFRLRYAIVFSIVICIVFVPPHRGGGGRSGTGSRRSLWCFFGFHLRQAFHSQTNTGHYYTTRVVRHWYVIGTEEQQLHKISHWSDK